MYKFEETMHEISAAEMEALKGSIAKWQGIVDGKVKDHACSNCPLCQVAFEIASPEIDQCFVCILHRDCNSEGCSNTPYIEFDNHRELEHNGINPDILCPTCIELARAERDFLIELKQRCQISKKL